MVLQAWKGCRNIRENGECSGLGLVLGVLAVFFVPRVGLFGPMDLRAWSGGLTDTLFNFSLRNRPDEVGVLLGLINLMRFLFGQLRTPQMLKDVGGSSAADHGDLPHAIEGAASLAAAAAELRLVAGVLLAVRFVAEFRLNDSGAP